MDLSTEQGPDIQTKSFLDQSRSKSAYRLRYEAEVQLLKENRGDLEDMRKKLGLTKRKMCQLLLVDPSAWTRWTSSGGSAPPHIYRALDWYLSFLEKDPQFNPLSERYSSWLLKEKEYATRLSTLEAQISAQNSKRGWRDYAPLILSFLAGVALALLGLHH